MASAALFKSMQSLGTLTLYLCVAMLTLTLIWYD
jgi:hypothetical protein